MKVANAYSIVSVLTVLAFGALSVNAAPTALPFADGFESGFDGSGSGVWSTNSSGDHVAASGAAAALAGSNGLILSNATATLAIEGGNTKVWLQVYSKPVAGADDPSVSSISGAFYLKDDGALRAYTGSWVEVASGLPTGQYLGFTVLADYDSDQWCLYYTSGAYGTNMTLANGAGTELQFAAAGTQIQTFSFESGDTAHFDGVAASPSFLSLGSCYENVQAVELSGAAVQGFTMPVYPARLTNGTDNLVSAAAGDALRTGMEENDRLIFLTHANGVDSSDNYDLLSGAWDKSVSTPGAPVETAKQLLMSSRLQLDRSNAGSTWAFLAYDTALAEDGEATGSGAGYQESVVINGTDVNSGFTAMTWAEAEASPNAMGFAAGNPVGGLDNLDILYVKTSTSGWRQYFWSSGANEFQDGGTTATENVPAGADCWIRRRTSTGSRAFTITH